jgi:hypothetical protein
MSNTKCCNLRPRFLSLSPQRVAGLRDATFPKRKFAARSLTTLFTLVTSVNLLLAAESSERATATGTWKWTFTMPDGTKVEPRVKLKQEGDKLTGTSKFREGFDRVISEGKISGNEVSFAVIRERDGKKTTTLYKGIQTGDRIKGTMESDWTGEKQTYPWEARRFTKDPAGTWEWSIRTRGRTNELKFTLTLTHENEQLTGTLNSTRGEVEIEEGTFKDGEVSFTAIREVDETKITSKYKGKVLGEIIRGKVDTAGGERGERSLPWEAKRID